MAKSRRSPRNMNVLKLVQKHSLELALVALLVALYNTRNYHVIKFVNSTIGRVVILGATVLMTYLRGPIAGVMVAVVGLMMMHKVYEGFEGEEEEEGFEGEEEEEGVAQFMNNEEETDGAASFKNHEEKIEGFKPCKDC
jgi:hypothetical protein